MHILPARTMQVYFQKVSFKNGLVNHCRRKKIIENGTKMFVKNVQECLVIKHKVNAEKMFRKSYHDYCTSLTVVIFIMSCCDVIIMKK